MTWVDRPLETNTDNIAKFIATSDYGQSKTKSLKNDNNRYAVKNFMWFFTRKEKERHAKIQAVFN